MKGITKWIILVYVFLVSCNMNTTKETLDKFKTEIINIEQEFATMAKEEDMDNAFLAFAAEDAVLNRNDEFLKGKEDIRTYFEKVTLKEIKLEWKPDFVDVATSGDLVYTYGRYLFSATDVKGNKVEDTGIFHMVWKRQADGSCRFVWD